MSKRLLFIMFILICGCVFLLAEKTIVKADYAVIVKKPVSEDIVYGHPLYSSKLKDGVSSVEGIYTWKDENKVLDVGEHEETVIFTSVNGETIEFNVDINVIPKRVYIEFENDLKKQYDGNDCISNVVYVVKGVIDSNVYVKGEISVKLDSVFVGVDIGVDVSGLSLEGEGKENYYLDLSGFVATIYPNQIEKFGNEKNKVVFSDGVYVPVNSILRIEEENLNLEIKDHEIKKVYRLDVISEGLKVDVDKKITVKLKIDENDLNYKRLVVYNYYNGSYTPVDYEYSNGQLVYSCVGLGSLVIASENYNYTWVYIISIIFMIMICAVVFVVYRKKYNRIQRYKSIKRRKDYANYM